jgi:signal transduction histidine kinase
MVAPAYRADRCVQPASFPESSSFALIETPFSLERVVQDAMSTFEAAAREKGLTIQSSLADTVPPRLSGDPVAIRRLLTNLRGNAVKFTATRI